VLKYQLHLIGDDDDIFILLFTIISPLSSRQARKVSNRLETKTWGRQKRGNDASGLGPRREQSSEVNLSIIYRRSITQPTIFIPKYIRWINKYAGRKCNCDI